MMHIQFTLDCVFVQGLETKEKREDNLRQMILFSYVWAIMDRRMTRRHHITSSVTYSLVEAARNSTRGRSATVTSPTQMRVRGPPEATRDQTARTRGDQSRQLSLQHET